MAEVKKKNGFDQDFLWLFQKVEQAAVCFSNDHDIIGITPAASSFFISSGSQVLSNPLSVLFAPFGIRVIFSKNYDSVSFKIIDKRIAKTRRSQRIQNLNWKVRPKLDGDGRVVGHIIYTEERTDIEYLAQVYEIVTGQEIVEQGSAVDYAVDIRNYLENIIASMPGNVYWMNNDCVYLGCNDNAAKFIGLDSRKDVIGITYEDMHDIAPWSIEHTDSWKSDNLEVIRTGKPKLNVEEEPVLMPNGDEIYYLTNRVPLFDKDDKVIGVLGISIDITDRKLMQRELQEIRERAEAAEKDLLMKVHREITGEVIGEEDTPVAYMKNVQNYLESIIARLPGNIYWMDKNCIYLGCNDNAAKFAGLSSRHQAVGLTYKEMGKIAGWTAEHIESWRRDDLDVIRTGKPKLNIEEAPVIMSGGEAIYYLTSRVPLFDDKQNVIGVAGVSIDITDRKRAEKLEKEKEGDVIEKTSEFMRMLAGSIAHEIRTPLAIIGINTDLLKINIKSLEIDELVEKSIFECLKNIKYAVDLASHIVTDILTMLKTISSNELLAKKFKAVSIKDDLTQVLSIYPFLEHERKLVKLDYSGLQDFIYCGDSVLTQHVLFNLMKNALHAIKGAEKGNIIVLLDEDRKYNILKFKDTAAGIPKDVLSKVFDYFKTGKAGGAGLGLAFCKVVMDAYGGDITCNSKDGRYTEFVLKFPKNVRCN